MKTLDPLRAKKIFIRKKLGHTAVSAIKASIKVWRGLKFRQGVQTKLGYVDAPKMINVSYRLFRRIVS